MICIYLNTPQPSILKRSKLLDLILHKTDGLKNQSGNCTFLPPGLTVAKYFTYITMPQRQHTEWGFLAICED